jgi:DNA-binding NtrC family response regulator
LRERFEDIAELTAHFIKHASRRLGVPQPRLTRLHLQELQSYDWPGNVRELQNVIERAVILAKGGKLHFDLPLRISRDSSLPPVSHPSNRNGEQAEEELSLDELTVREREIVATALRRTNWKIYGADGAAALLRIKPTTLVSKMKRLKIERAVA